MRPAWNRRRRGSLGFLAAGDNLVPLPQPQGRHWTGQPGGCYDSGLSLILAWDPGRPHRTHGAARPGLHAQGPHALGPARTGPGRTGLHSWGKAIGGSNMAWPLGDPAVR